MKLVSQCFITSALEFFSKLQISVTMWMNLINGVITCNESVGACLRRMPRMHEDVQSIGGIQSIKRKVSRVVSSSGIIILST